MSKEHNNLTINYVPPEVALPLVNPNCARMLHPKEKNFWIRHLPNNHSSRHRRPLGQDVDLSPHEAVNVALSHFNKLQSIGVPTPPTEFFLIQAPRPEDTILYAKVAHVKGINGLHLDQEQAAKHFSSLMCRLMRYVEWVELTNQPCFLSDIAEADQHVLGKCNEKETSNTLYLVDVDILLRKTEGRDFEAFISSIEQGLGSLATRQDLYTPIK